VGTANQEFYQGCARPDGQAVVRLRVGRNAPCPCGSGRKYKHCCLQKDRRDEVERGRMDRAEDSLRAKILEFMAQDRFKGDGQRAWEIWSASYHGEPPDDEVDVIRFADWLVHDYRMGRWGKTLIELFREEEGWKLGAEEGELLNGRLDSCLGLYEVTRVEPGKGVELSELYTGEECFVHDVSSSENMVRWDVTLTRVLPVADRFAAEGAALYAPRAQKHDLMELGKELFDKYRTSNPGASWKQFMKEEGYLFNSFYARAEEKVRNIKFVTAEGDNVVISTAVYAVKDLHRVVSTLERMKEIHVLDILRDPGRRTKEAHFRWAARMRQEVPESRGDGKTVLVSLTLEGTGETRPIVGLGDIDVNHSELVLECLSRERLERGRCLLEQHIGEWIEHLYTEHQPPGVGTNGHQGDGARAGRRMAKEDSEARQVIQLYLNRHYGDWADTSLPLLGGKTPRQAFRTDKGRKEVEELLKDLENVEERRKKEGRASYDVERMRAKLKRGWSRDEPIQPSSFCSTEQEKTKLNWFCYELSLNIHDRLVMDLGKRLRAKGMDDEAICRFAVSMSKRLKEEIVSRLSKGLEKMRLSYRMVESCLPGLDDDELVNEILDAVSAAWEWLLEGCQICPTRCLTERDEYCTMFDEGPY